MMLGWQKNKKTFTSAVHHAYSVYTLIVFSDTYKSVVDEKLISQSKKEMDFIWGELRIITWEQHLRKLQELFCLPVISHNVVI